MIQRFKLLPQTKFFMQSVYLKGGCIIQFDISFFYFQTILCNREIILIGKFWYIPITLPIQYCNHYFFFFFVKEIWHRIWLNTNQKMITSCDLLYIFPNSVYFKYLPLKWVYHYVYIDWLKFINKGEESVV